MSAQPARRGSSAAVMVAWLLVAVSVAALFFFIPAALVGGLVAGAIAHSRGAHLARNVALVVVLFAVIAVIFGGFGGSFEGGLSESSD